MYLYFGYDLYSDITGNLKIILENGLVLKGMLPYTNKILIELYYSLNLNQSNFHWFTSEKIYFTF